MTWGVHLGLRQLAHAAILHKGCSLGRTLSVLGSVVWLLGSWLTRLRVHAAILACSSILRHMLRVHLAWLGWNHAHLRWHASSLAILTHLVVRHHAALVATHLRVHLLTGRHVLGVHSLMSSCDSVRLLGWRLSHWLPIGRHLVLLTGSEPTSSSLRRSATGIPVGLLLGLVPLTSIVHLYRPA